MTNLKKTLFLFLSLSCFCFTSCGGSGSQKLTKELVLEQFKKLKYDVAMKNLYKENTDKVLNCIAEKLSSKYSTLAEWNNSGNAEQQKFTRECAKGNLKIGK